MGAAEISNALPTWATSLGSVLVFLTTFGFAAYGWIKKQLPVEAKRQQGDTVVLSAAIADSAAIHRLAGAIDAMVQADALNRVELQIIAAKLDLILSEMKREAMHG